MRSPTCSRPHLSAGDPEHGDLVSVVDHDVDLVPGMILPMVEPALLTLEMITNPNPSFSNLDTVTSYG